VTECDLLHIQSPQILSQELSVEQSAIAIVFDSAISRYDSLIVGPTIVLTLILINNEIMQCNACEKAIISCCCDGILVQCSELRGGIHCRILAIFCTVGANFSLVMY